MTLDTPHEPITTFLKKCPKNAGKIKGKIIWCLIQKLDQNSGLHAKNQREIVTKSEGFFGLKEGENAGIGEEMV